MKKWRLSSLFSITILAIIVIISLCKEDIYGNIKLSFTVGNYLNLIKFDNLKVLLFSWLTSLLAIIILITILYPFIKAIINVKRRKQYLTIFFVLLPLTINSLYKSYLLLRLSNYYVSLLLSIMVTLMPYVFIVMFYILKTANMNQLDAVRDLKENSFKGFIKIIWPSIKEKTVFWLSFLTIVGSNLFLMDNNGIYLGNIIYNDIIYHNHIPYVCAIVSIEYILFLLINSHKGVKNEK